MFETFFAIVTSSFQRAPWGWATLGVLIAGYFKLKPLMTRLANEREANLLNERAEEMAGMRERIERLEALAELKDRQHEAERAVDRHRINNLSQCLDALLLLIEQDPSKASEAAAKIRAMRADQLKREAQEKATIRAAVISTVGGGGPGGD